MEFISLQSDVIVFIYYWCGKVKDFVLSVKKYDFIQLQEFNV